MKLLITSYHFIPPESKYSPQHTFSNTFFHYCYMDRVAREAMEIRLGLDSINREEGFQRSKALNPGT
jgi:hypothetical protein